MDTIRLPSLCAALLGCVIGLLPASPLRGEVIDFNDVVIPSHDGEVYHNPMYQPGYLYPTSTGNDLHLPGFSDGVLASPPFSFEGEHFHVVDLPGVHGAAAYGGAADDGTFYLNSERAAPITLASVGGKTFALRSLDAAECFVDVDAFRAAGFTTASRLVLSGRRSDGSTVTLELPLDGLNDGFGGAADFEHFDLPPGWDGLVSVTAAGMDGTGEPGAFSIDNVDAVLEPTRAVFSGAQLLVDGQPLRLKGVVYNPAPIGDAPALPPHGDYFTADRAELYRRDLGLLRDLGANAVRVTGLAADADHRDFLDAAFDAGVRPVYVIAEFRIPAGLDIDPLSPANDRARLVADFRGLVARHTSHPAILMWSIGDELTGADRYGNSLPDLFSLVEEMAAAARLEEGTPAHPVVAALADVDLASTISLYEAAVPSLDAWGATVHRGASFGALFSDHRAVASKPLVVLGYGIDAWDTVGGDEHEFVGDPLQASAAEALWLEIEANADVCPGGTYSEFRDQWWRGALSDDAGCVDPDPATHGLCGRAVAGFPDGYANEEWYGIMRATADGSAGDDLAPRAVFGRLQSLWTTTTLTLLVNGGDSFTRSSSVTLGLQCGPSAAQCAAMQFSNDGVVWSPAATFSASASWALVTGNGPKTVFARVQDQAGNWSDPASDTIVLDVSAPTTTASPAGGTYAGAVSVTLSCSDGTGSGCAQTFYTTDGTTPTTGSTVYGGPIALTASATLKCFSKDLAGNSGGVRTYAYTVDSLAPAGTITIAGGAAYTRSQAATLTLSCTDDRGCYQMQFSNDGLTWGTAVAYAATRTWTMTAGNGEKTVHARFRDLAGNWSNPVSDTIVLDVSAPTTTASPAGGSYAGAVSVTLSCNDGTGSGCAQTFYTTDGTTPTAGSTVYGGPITLTASTTLKCFSKDVAGNSGGIRSYTYAIDSTPPAGTITIAGGAAYTRSQAAALTLTCTDNRGCYQMQFSNDGLTWGTAVAYATTRTWAMTAGNGEKTVHARFRDLAGNWSAPVSDTIVLDVSAPTTTASPAGGTYAGAVSVTLSCGDGTGSGCAQTFYTTDGTTPTTGSTVYGGPIALTASATLKCFSKDVAGNSGGIRTYTYTIDSVAPTGTITIAGGAAYTRSQAAALTLSCTDDRGCYQMQFSNDGLTWGTAVAYTTTRTWAMTAGNGSKTVHARFRDLAGNWSAPVSDTVVLDLSAPTTTAAPAGGTYAGAVSVTLSCGDGTGAGCAQTFYTTDGTTPTAGSAVYGGPIPLTATSTLRYFSKDAVGNSEGIRTQVYTIRSAL